MLSPQERSQPITFFALLFVACLLLCGIAGAEPPITLSKKSGPPTSRILVSGHGFKPSVGVDIYFDTKDEALVVTNREGEFDHAKIYAPRSARPGKHWVTALERNNDKGAQESFLVQTDWGEFSFNSYFDAGGRRVNPYENVLNVNNVGRLGVDWRFPTRADVGSSPAVVNGVVYVGSGDKNVYALNARTGAKLWSYATGDGVYTSPAVAKEVVYVGSLDQNVYALNARTGAKLWSYNLGYRVYSSPAIANGVVYVGSEDGNVYALDAHTGAKLWSYNLGNPVYSSPAIANGVVYIAPAYQSVYALNARTGTLLWSYNFGYIAGSFAVAKGVVYGTAGSSIYALNARTGTLLWSYDIHINVSSSAAVANGVVYLAGYALNARTGTLLWRYDTGNGSPAVANGVVYVSSLEGNVDALDANTGALLWTYTTDAAVYSSPSVANGVVYVGSGHKVYAFGATRSAEQGGEDSKHPELKTLRPDFNLKVSQPVATPTGAEL